MSGHLDDLLGIDVEVYDGCGGGSLMGKGRVVAIAYEPTIVIQHEDGTQSSHVASLPRTEYRPVKVGRT